uniref:Uncharacterized protein n=1 Tax=Timema cristinae TaxID=61476 RepID=A0A7R9CYQ8_TIMCR|nr:unnamed protein product [Timema cristinae]
MVWGMSFNAATTHCFNNGQFAPCGDRVARPESRNSLNYRLTRSEFESCPNVLGPPFSQWFSALLQRKCGSTPVRMKLQLVLLAVVVSLLVSDVLGDKVRKYKKFRRHRTTSTTTTTTESEPEIAEEGEKDLYSMLEQDEKEQDKQDKEDEDKPDSDEIKDNNVAMHARKETNTTFYIIADPCAEKHCGAGRVCVLDELRTSAVCVHTRMS